MTALTERSIRTATELLHIALDAPEVAAELAAYKKAMADVIWLDVNGGMEVEKLFAKGAASLTLKNLLRAVANLDRAAYAC
jgi:hypothetical protein